MTTWTTAAAGPAPAWRRSCAGWRGARLAAVTSCFRPSCWWSRWPAPVRRPSPPAARPHLGAADWALLVVGPLALVFRRRYPVAVLWVAFLVTLPPSGTWPANLSLIAAFFFAATGGHRRAAWVVIVDRLPRLRVADPAGLREPGGLAHVRPGARGWLAVLVSRRKWSGCAVSGRPRPGRPGRWMGSAGPARNGCGWPGTCTT